MRWGKISRLARHEARRLRSSPVTWMVSLAMIAAMAYALAGGFAFADAQRTSFDETVQHQQETYNRELAILEGRVEASEDELAAASATRGRSHAMHLPPRPLGALAIGQSDLLPSAYGISIYNKQRTREDRYGYENPQSLLNGRFDLAMILIQILPLIIIAFSFDVLSRERESGTLAMLLITPVTPREVLLGKLLPRAVLILGLVAAASGIGGLLAGWGAPDLAGDLALFTTVAVLYGAFWFAAAALIAFWGRRSAFNAMALVLLWVTLVFVLPAITQLASAQQAPVDPRIEAVLASRSKTENFFAARPRLVQEWYEAYPDLRTAERSPETVGRSFSSGFFLNQWDMDHRSAPVEAAIDAQLQQQQGLIDRLAVLSPAMLAREAFNELAGTDLRRHLAFRTQAEAYREEWRRFFGPLFIHDLRLDASEYASMPRFRFAEDGDRARRNGQRLLLLSLWIGLSTTLLFRVAKAPGPRS